MGALGSLLCAFIALGLIGCGGESVASEPAGAAPAHDIGVSNGTTLPVSIFVNGALVETIAPKMGREIPGPSLPTLPWDVEAKSPTGRVLIRFRVEAGTVTATMNRDGTGTSRGAGGRADLSCGRLDVFVGPPMSGPVPGPGRPGDCDP
jgi:hypothetical protein